jgi:hypothetical protein
MTPPTPPTPPTSPTPPRGREMLLTLAWLVAAVAMTAVYSYGGVALAMLGGLVIRSRWKLFVAEAIPLLAVALLLAPVGGSGVGSGGALG